MSSERVQVSNEISEHSSTISGRPHKASHHDIVVTSWQLFEEIGFEATTMAQIAEHCGMSRRTLFNYFANKDALLFPGFHDCIEALENALLKRPVDEKIFDALMASVDAATAKLREIAETYPPGPEVSAARLSESATNYTRSLWAVELEHIAQARLGDSQEAKIQAALIGVITAQVINEISKLQRRPNQPLDEEAATNLVLAQIPALFRI